MKKPLPVRFITSNSHGDYYKVNGAFNVIHQTGVSHPFVCVDDRSNDCEHIEAVQDYIQEHSADNTERAA